jgi:hypothetical protein
MNDVVQSLLNGLNQTQTQELIAICAHWMSHPGDWNDAPALPTIPARKLNELRAAYELSYTLSIEAFNPRLLKAVIKAGMNAIDDAALESIAA